MAWFLGAYGAQGGKNLGIYNCRPLAGSNTLSLHGEGRACDLGVPVGAPWAWTLADSLVAQSAELGIQREKGLEDVLGRAQTDWRTIPTCAPH